MCILVEWQKATVFISSTFDDMHAERDYLIKEVFPELKFWAEKRKIHLTDIDLRWGITEEESENKGTVGTCLRHIDKCRPFFICFIGQRIGWIPDFKHDINEETKNRYPSIQKLVNNKSLTEIEIEHAIFSPLYQKINDGKIEYCPPTKFNLFFFRQDNFTDKLNDAQKSVYGNNTEDDEKLEIIKNRILNKEEEINNGDCEDKICIKVNRYCGQWNEDLTLRELSHYGNSVDKGRLTNFKCGNKPLKDVIIEQLKEQITQAFPDNKEIDYDSRIDKELDKQNIFIYKNNENFIERFNYMTSLKKYVESEERTTYAVISKPGYGKTMLLSKFTNNFGSLYPNKKLYKRFCGTSNLSLDNYLLWKSIIDEAGIDKSKNIYPNDYDELKNNACEILEEISRKGDSVIVIDALNQMENGLDMLEWIPKLPDNLKIIISFTDNSDDENLSLHIKNENISSDYLVIDELNDDEKRDLIKSYLKNYLKELDNEEIDKICHLKGSGNPLYLKILLTELCLLGSHNQLESKIEQFGDTPETAFDHVLERLEEDEKLKGKTRIVPLIFYHLSKVKLGLSEQELVSIIKIKTKLDDKYIKDIIRISLRQVRPFMVQKEGKHDFYDGSFKDAALKRYANLT